MYTGARIVVRTVYGNTKCFEVKVGMHQGSALSALQFVIVMEALSREFIDALPWELLYADDVLVVAETEDDLIKRLTWVVPDKVQGAKGSISKVMKLFICRGCLNPVNNTGCTSVDICISANLEYEVDDASPTVRPKRT